MGVNSQLLESLVEQNCQKQCLLKECHPQLDFAARRPISFLLGREVWPLSRSSVMGRSLRWSAIRKCGVFREPLVPVSSGLSPAQFRRVTEYIHDQLTHELTPVELAAAAGLSRAHCAQMFKRSAEVPRHQFVNNVHVVRAKALLRESNLRMIDAAIACGFQTSQHFARVFKRFSGVSPLMFRRSI
jgi:AraC family transcriptional regulator